ncbi:hypothetical protein QQF64_026441, partial [Cirrhinus molitorella]
DISRSLMNLWHYMGETRSSIQLLSYKLSFTNLLTTGCTEPDWIPFSNSCYHFSHDTLNWTEAKDYCAEQDNGYLGSQITGPDMAWERKERTVGSLQYMGC